MHSATLDLSFPAMVYLAILVKGRICCQFQLSRLTIQYMSNKLINPNSFHQMLYTIWRYV
jgi:hypothetical protein